jgi:hypothetical protein
MFFVGQYALLIIHLTKGVTMNSNQKPDEFGSPSLREKLFFEESQNSGWIPKHECSKNLKIISQTHSVNSLHNIVIAQTKQCKICGKKFEESNPEGIR